MQIPVGSETPWFIETGLDYRNKPTISQKDGYDFNPMKENIMDDERDYFVNYRTNYLELPVRIGYNFRLNEKNSVNVSVGPYVNTAISTLEGGDLYGRPISVGMSISAAFRHRCMSYGLTYSNPIFLNGPRDYYKNSLLVTIGINFGKKAWKHVGTAALIMGSVAGAGAAIYSATQGSSNSYPSYTGSSQYSENNSEEISSGDASNAETMYYKWEKRAKAAYESLNGHSISPSLYTKNKKLLREAQSEMRKYRKKAKQKGLDIKKSEYEDVNIKPL